MTPLRLARPDELDADLDDLRARPGLTERQSQILVAVMVCFLSMAALALMAWAGVGR